MRLLHTTQQCLFASGSLLFFGFANLMAAPLPDNATLVYTGPMGTSAVMTIKSTATQYNINTAFKIPLYQMQFLSSGSINGKQLRPSNFTDNRKGKLYSSASINYGTKQITYGKANDKKNVAIQGIPMDMFSLAWQLGLNQGKFANKLQLTNGKKVYTDLSAFTQKTGNQFSLGGKSYSSHIYESKRNGSVYRYELLPGLYNIPAIIQFNDDKNYKLKLKSATINGQKY